MPKYPDLSGFDLTNLPDPVFKKAQEKMLHRLPMVPLLELPPMPTDVENKEGWTVTEAVKDALLDGMRESWKKGWAAAVETFPEVVSREMAEFADWNPEQPVREMRIPFLGVKVWTWRVKHVRWLKRKLFG